ncbi:hypothetical protein BJ944DRAFT_244540 [Cunninghamella echinulata]|nr:hypothetical protein BJ944DRAFT_244540 [Cunninghamella echinulata]
MKRSSSKKIIAIELDQTLVSTLPTLIDWHNEQYETNLTVKDITTRDMSRIFGGTKEEGCMKLREFYESDQFKDMEPMDTTNSSWGALEVLQTLKKRKWSLVIVTSRPQFTSDITQRFIDRHFPGLFDDIYYCNQGLSVVDQLDYVPKPISILCQEIGADYLIDDTLDHCLDCSVLVDMTLLLYDHQGKYKYNHLLPNNKRRKNERRTLTSTSKQLYQRSSTLSSSLPNNVLRVTSWKAILDHFPMPASPLRRCHYPDDTTKTVIITTTILPSRYTSSSWQDQNQYVKVKLSEDEDEYRDCIAV